MTKTGSSNRKNVVVPALRSLWHLLAVIAVTAWGFVKWEFPLPGLAFGIGAFIVAVLLWALFLSPRPVLRADRFAQSMIELLLLAGAVAALIEMDVNWVLAAIFGVIGVVLGYINGLRGSAE